MIITLRRKDKHIHFTIHNMSLFLTDAEADGIATAVHRLQEPYSNENYAEVKTAPDSPYRSSIMYDNHQ